MNCKYEPLDETKQNSLEGCLSIKNKFGGLRYFLVERHKNITITGSELIIKPFLEIVDLSHNESDYYSTVFQHEIDHGGWDGKSPTLISDIGKEFQVWE